MTNRVGYILGIVSAIIYTLFHNKINLDYILDFLPQILGAFVGALLIPSFISGIIYIFSRKNFGKIFGISSLIVHVISSFGNIVGN